MSVLFTTTQTRGRVCTDLMQHVVDREHLSLGLAVRAVDHVKQQIGLGDLVEGGLERLDETVRQLV